MEDKIGSRILWCRLTCVDSIAPKRTTKRRSRVKKRKSSRIRTENYEGVRCFFKTLRSTKQPRFWINLGQDEHFRHNAIRSNRAFDSMSSHCPLDYLWHRCRIYRRFGGRRVAWLVIAGGTSIGQNSLWQAGEMMNQLVGTSARKGVNGL